MNEQEVKAFEFVLGTLPPDEREAFQAELKSDNDLKQQVHYWEGHLDELNNPEETLQPNPNTWSEIQAAIAPKSNAQNTDTKARWLNWLPWGLTAAMSFALVLMITVGNLPVENQGAVPIDYVAVLTDETGQAKLTAVTEGDSKNMWLQWEKVALESDQDLQIWALSKSDNQIRSIAVIGNQDTQSLQLSEAHWRLVTDAATLILTAEEEGGSAIDEPSDMIVAKGVCVQLNRKEKTS